MTLLLWIFLVPGLRAQNSDAEEFFESKVRPVLAANCYSCHTGSQSGGLRLDSREAMLRGGKSGPAIVPGNAKDSLLIQATSHTHARLKMPPGDKLEESDAAGLVRWVNEGAVWPKSAPISAAGPGYQITAQQRAFWSFQQVRKPEPPPARLDVWKRNPIDAFILARLDEKKLAPLPRASKLTLIRRAAFDLTGLPPAPEDVDAFLADRSPDAFAKAVDRLLASPEYGERWGRHWLDVVRYADTAGDASDYPIPQAYLYRDYVIQSFRDDKPYDQFLREQLAGDLLPAATEPEKWEHTVATGYLAQARRFNVNPLQNMHLTVDDAVDNLGKTILGLSISCARCHDHKFDPIPNTDYYALYGIFQSTKFPFPGSEKNHRPSELIPRDQKEFDAVMKPYLEELYKITGRLGKVEGEKRAFVEGANNALRSTPGRTMNDILAEIKELEAKREPILARMPKVDVAYAVREGSPGNARIQKRGEPKDLGEEVPRGFLKILYTKDTPRFDGSGRLELARWVTDPSNPLPARVMVNRIWQHHFGKGLVATPSDFGKRGTAPTHPDLLDFLASRFVESGWSIKAMHRLMMVSETYQLAGGENAANQEIDAGNDFLWRFNRRRLDAESLRDALLAISGELERGPSGPHPFPHMGTWMFMQHGPFNAVYPSKRRSVYLMTQRIQRHPYLAMFDGADAAISTAVRPQTITPIQALFFMNSQLLHDSAGAWAERLTAALPDERGRVERAYRTALGRPASKEELARATQYIAAARRTLKSEGGANAEQEPLSSFLRALLASNEFLFVD